jgi:hypothetical protein
MHREVGRAKDLSAPRYHIKEQDQNKFVSEFSVWIFLRNSNEIR